MNLGIRTLARKIKCECGELGAVVDSKARGTRSGKQGCVGGSGLSCFEQDIDVIADGIRQVFVIAKDNKDDARLLPGPKHGGDELADFFLLGRLRHKVEKFRFIFQWQKRERARVW